PAFVNIAFPGRVLETGTTCEMYSDGTAIDLDEVIYNISRKDQVINNVAPGVFFYYTTFKSPGEAAFTVNVNQSNDGTAVFPNFTVQNASNVRLFNGDCSMPTVSYSFGFDSGQVWLDFAEPVTPGAVFILSVKYETNPVVGQPIPSPTTVHYDFETRIGGNLVDTDLQGLDLKQKGTK
ncbi:MAG: hypothetical protein JJE12_04240, partial [Anaerolineales bacterium]|nr:hypothetical protein [Anaerolineales bacterium]